MGPEKGLYLSSSDRDRPGSFRFRKVENQAGRRMHWVARAYHWCLI